MHFDKNSNLIFASIHQCRLWSSEKKLKISPPLPAVVPHHAVSEAHHQLLRTVRVHVTDDQILTQQCST
jgi:hypothetical protein